MNRNIAFKKIYRHFINGSQGSMFNSIPFWNNAIIMATKNAMFAVDEQRDKMLTRIQCTSDRRYQLLGLENGDGEKYAPVYDESDNWEIEEARDYIMNIGI